MGCIYKVTNKINGKCYIGKTTKTLSERKKQHINNAYSKKNGPYFHKAIKKYSPENFEWKILYTSNSENVLNDLERACINKYDSYNSGYNLTKGGDGVSGWHHSEETKKKISEAGMGKHPSEETRRKIGDKHKGKIVSKETREKLSKAVKGEKNHNYGKKFSKEHCQKISNALSGENHPLYGKHPSEETRRKLSESRRGEKNHNYGKSLDKKTKRKLSKSQRPNSLFGFIGGNYKNKKGNPWNKVWYTQISYNGNRKFLGYFNDPLTCQIVHDFVADEIFGTYQKK